MESAQLLRFPLDAPGSAPTSRDSLGWEAANTNCPGHHRLLWAWLSLGFPEVFQGTGKLEQGQSFRALSLCSGVVWEGNPDRAECQEQSPPRGIIWIKGLGSFIDGGKGSGSNPDPAPRKSSVSFGAHRMCLQ